jgi:hypothetical protein
VLEYWSVDFEEKEERFELSRLFRVLFLFKRQNNRIFPLLHHSSTPILQKIFERPRTLLSPLPGGKSKARSFGPGSLLFLRSWIISQFGFFEK